MKLFLTLFSTVVMAQTVPSDKQVTKKLTPMEGVLVQTADGVKAAFPLPGFAYVVGGQQVQILPSDSKTVILSEVPIRQPDGRYTLKYRPNPAIIAVFRNGARLSPTKYKLVWLDRNQLPDRFEIPDSTESDEIVVDYAIGASATLP